VSLFVRTVESSEVVLPGLFDLSVPVCWRLDAFSERAAEAALASRKTTPNAPVASRRRLLARPYASFSWVAASKFLAVACDSFPFFGGGADCPTSEARGLLPSRGGARDESL